MKEDKPLFKARTPLQKLTTLVFEGYFPKLFVLSHRRIHYRGLQPEIQ